jgi:hypothetical protein
MKVCGFTFIRNGVKFDYPFFESIHSILPICDCFIISVGNSDDNTLQAIQKIDSPKIKIIESVWDDSLRKDGKVLAVETDKAFQAIPEEFDWAFYLQADEVVHEDSLIPITEAMQKYLTNDAVEGLLLKYNHFYGSYEYVGDAYSWCRREIRVLKNRKHFFSYKDAQGFRKKPNDKLNVKLIDGYVFHYSWVKEPKLQQEKLETFNRFWHSDSWVDEKIKKENFIYNNDELVVPFKSTHPKVMESRIAGKKWDYSPPLANQRKPLKHRVKRLVEQLTGWRIGEYRNYTLIR